MDSSKEIFKGKSLSDLFGEIYDNSRETKGQVKALIGELKPLIENIGDATLIVPMIKEYMEIGVKNDEHLIKLATVIQRIEKTSSLVKLGISTGITSTASQSAGSSTSPKHNESR